MRNGRRGFIVQICLEDKRTSASSTYPRGVISVEYDAHTCSMLMHAATTLHQLRRCMADYLRTDEI